MKKTVLFCALSLWTFVCLAISPTTFTFQFYDASGQPNTNYTTMQGWPPSSGSVTVVSNVIVWAGDNQVVTNQFYGTNTIGTNSVMPNTYKIFCPATGLGFFATIPQTTNILPLATYATGVPVTYASSSLYFYITNAIGGPPALANYSSIISALGFVPATNGASLSYSLLPFTPPTNTFSGLTFALGFNPATNGGAIAYSQLPYAPGITNGNGVSLTNIPNVALQFTAATNGSALSYSQLPFTPPTNTFSGLVAALGYTPATNNPATNTFFYLTNVAVVTNGSGVATNVSLTFGTNTLNYQHQ